jgi:hypothetical protein
MLGRKEDNGVKINQLSESEIKPGLCFTLYEDTEVKTGKVVYIYQAGELEPRYIWFRWEDKKLDYFLDNHAIYEVMIDEDNQIAYQDDWMTEADNLYQQDENAVFYYQKERSALTWKKMEQKYVDNQQDLLSDLLSSVPIINIDNQD